MKFDLSDDEMHTTSYEQGFTTYSETWDQPVIFTVMKFWLVIDSTIHWWSKKEYVNLCQYSTLVDSLHRIVNQIRLLF